MPLERFIPKSPDPFIRNSQDFEVAKFGHLNTIIEYVNNYVVTDGLQLSGTGPLSTSLRNVTDNLGNASPLKLSTLGVQIVSPLRISTDDPSDMYLDCEDGSENNRFNITRNTGSQQVNLNFASNPAGSTTIVGAIRTYVDGTNLSEVMQFREDGSIFGRGTQAANNLVIQQSNDVGNLYVYNSATWGLLTTPPNGSANTTFNGRIIGTHGGAGNSALALGTIVADTSGSNFNLSIGQASTITTAQNGLAIGRLTSITGWSNATAIGYGAIAGANNAVALGDVSALLQIGGNFTPTARVHVRGTGSTSATTSLLVQNSSGTEALKVTDDRTTTISGTQTNLSTTNVYVGALSLTSAGVGATGQGIWSTGTDGQMVLAGSLGGFVIKGWAGYTVSLINNSNPRNLFSIQQYGFSDGNTSGLTGNTMNITPIYNFIGVQSSATVRGIYYNPTLTSLVNTTHYGIQTTSGGAYINTSTPQSSACLQADSTTQGFLPPRMTSTQRTAIASPASGLIVYDTTTNKSYTYDGTTWQAHY
jgi:hypothetical protein